MEKNSLHITTMLKFISLPHYAQPYYTHITSLFTFLQTCAKHQISTHEQTHNFA